MRGAAFTTESTELTEGKRGGDAASTETSCSSCLRVSYSTNLRQAEATRRGAVFTTEYTEIHGKDFMKFYSQRNPSCISCTSMFKIFAQRGAEVRRGGITVLALRGFVGENFARGSRIRMKYHTQKPEAPKKK